jgi:hypothetical protein
VAAATAALAVACGSQGQPAPASPRGSATAGACDVQDVTLDLLGPPSPEPKLTYRAGQLIHLVDRTGNDGAPTWSPSTVAVSTSDAAQLESLACATIGASTPSASPAARVGAQYFLTVRAGGQRVASSGEIAELQADPLAQALVTTADRYFHTDVLDFRPGGGNYGGA